MEKIDRKKHKQASFFWGMVLIFYMILLLYIARFDQYTVLVNKVISPLFAFVVIIRFILLRKEGYFPKEFYIHGLFTLWALTGLTFSVNHAAFFNYYKILVEALFLYLVIYSIASLNKTGVYLYWSIVIVGLLLMWNAYLSGDLMSAFTVAYYRAKGVAKNPNEFAYALLMGIWGVLYLWGLYKGKLVKIIFVSIVVLMIVGIIASASRKTFATMVLFFVGWVFYSNSDFVKENKSTFILALLMVLLGSFAVYKTIGRTSMEERINYLLHPYGEDPTGGRIALYKEGFEIVAKHPIFGVGLGNFVFHSALRKYTHSDFMEVATNTGLVGLIIYLLIYIVLWKRLSKTLNLLKIVPMRSPKTLRRIYEVKLMQLILLSHIIIGLGRPHFIDIYSLTMIGILISYSYILRKVVISEVVSQTL